MTAQREGRPAGKRDALTDQSAAKRNDHPNCSATQRLHADGSHVVMLEAEVREVREFPAALMRWNSPEDCAEELIDTFGKTWARMLSLEIRVRIGRGGV